MNEAQKYEWKMMVQSAELSLKSTCPLLEDEIIVEVNKRIAELDRRIRDLEKPQFLMSEGGDFSGGSFCCNHCNFSSDRFADRDEHIKSCVEREKYLRGETKE